MNGALLMLGAADPAAVAPIPSPGSNLYTFLLAAVVVIGLAYVASRLLGNWQVTVGRGRRMRVLEGVSIGKDRNLVLVAVGKEVLVLGSSQSGVSLVHRIEDPRQAAELLLDQGPDLTASKGSGNLEESIRESLSRMRNLLAKAGGSSNA